MVSQCHLWLSGSADQLKCNSFKYSVTGDTSGAEHIMSMEYYTTRKRDRNGSTRKTWRSAIVFVILCLGSYLAWRFVRDHTTVRSSDYDVDSNGVLPEGQGHTWPEKWNRTRYLFVLYFLLRLLLMKWRFLVNSLLRWPWSHPTQKDAVGRAMAELGIVRAIRSNSRWALSLSNTIIQRSRHMYMLLMACLLRV